MNHLLRMVVQELGARIRDMEAKTLVSFVIIVVFYRRSGTAGNNVQISCSAVHKLHGRPVAGPLKTVDATWCIRS